MLPRGSQTGCMEDRAALVNTDPQWGMVLIVIVVSCVTMYFKSIKAKAVLQEWAQDNGLRLLTAKVCFFMPWRIYNSMSTTFVNIIYRVSVYDESTHRIRAAYARLGRGRWGTMDHGAIRVTWDDGAQPASP